MRLFIALDIPAEVRTALSSYVEKVRQLAPDARWARVEGLHVTLKFIGAFADDRITELKTALANVKHAPCPVNFDGTGFFPNTKSPRVFWAGVEGGGPLSGLAGAIDQEVMKLGVAKEDRPYHPHLTLARANDHGNLRALLHAPAAPTFGTMTAREFFLYQSQPQRGGSRYTKLERFRLE